MRLCRRGKTQNWLLEAALKAMQSGLRRPAAESEVPSIPEHNGGVTVPRELRIFLPAASRSIRGYVCSSVRPFVRYSFKKRGVPIWGISRTFANDQEECQLEGLSRTFAIFICLNIIIVIDWRYLKALLFFVKTSFSPSGWRCTLDWLKRGRVGTTSFMVK